jgi:alkylhydroperoxidase/carboxymuconolactone decarboxylase family protein YurZ
MTIKHKPGPEQMLGNTKAEEFKAALRDLCPDFEDYVIGFLSGEIWSRPGLDKRTKSLRVCPA